MRKPVESRPDGSCLPHSLDQQRLKIDDSLVAFFSSVNTAQNVASCSRELFDSASMVKVHHRNAVVQIDRWSLELDQYSLLTSGVKAPAKILHHGVAQSAGASDEPNDGTRRLALQDPYFILACEALPV